MGLSQTKISPENYKKVLIINPKFDSVTSIDRRFMESKTSQHFKTEFETYQWKVEYLPNLLYTTINYNTFSSRESAYRKTLKQIYIQNISQRNFWIIHVKPSISPTEYDCVLSMPFGNHHAQNITNEIKDRLSKDFIYADVLSADDENDITYEATTEYQFKNIIIIEISQKIKDEKMRYIVEIIVKWMNDNFNIYNK